MADLTVPITCQTCGEALDVPLNIISSAESTTAGHALVTVEADPQFLADHNTSCTATTLANTSPTLLPAHVAK